MQAVGSAQWLTVPPHPGMAGVTCLLDKHDWTVRRCHCPNGWGIPGLSSHSSSSTVFSCLHAPSPFHRTELDWQCKPHSYHSTLNFCWVFVTKTNADLCRDMLFFVRNVGCRAVVLLRFIHSLLAYDEALCERQEKLAPGRWGCICFQVEPQSPSVMQS